MKKIPLDPEHRARQKKIRKMLAAGLPLAVLMSGLSGCDEGPRARMPGDIAPLSRGMLPPDDWCRGGEQIPEVHVVKEGDTLETIARQYGTPVAKLKELNSLTDEQADLIKPGQKIRLK